MKSQSALARIASGFLLAFLADGLISMSAEIFSALHIAVPGWEVIRTIVALAVILWACIMYVIVFLTPRLKKRLLLPAIIFSIWASFGSSFPLTLLDIPHLGLFVSGAQTVLGALLFIAWRKYHQPIIDETRPSFSWGNFAVGGCVSFVIALFCVLSVVVTAADAIDTHTGGYATIRPSGFYLEERRFRKEDKEVRLIGMVHVAQAAFYNSVAEDLRSTDSAVVLLEGVSDDKGLLKKRLSYNGVADFIGITSQEKSTFTSQAVGSLRGSPDKSRSPIEYMHADLDISALQPRTVALVEALSALLASKSIPEALTHLQDKNSPLNDEAGMKAAMVDLLATRNTHLLATMRSALATTNVVIVPWGAMHLQDLQEELEKMGFQEVSHKARLALSFSPF